MTIERPKSSKGFTWQLSGPTIRTVSCQPWGKDWPAGRAAIINRQLQLDVCWCQGALEIEGARTEFAFGAPAIFYAWAILIFMPYSLLEGLNILELGGGLAAPYCGKLLADMGAQVIKIETPGTGDSSRQYGPFLNDEPHRERSGLYLYLNANKKGITLNLETPTGRSILRDLVSQSDALVHNLPVADLEQLGMQYSQLSQTNPQLIMASITPFGLDGPYRDYKAYDINLAAAGGICEGLGEAGREPLTFGTPEVGYFSGLAAASSIVLALLARESSGGQHIDIAEVESLAGIYNGPEALMAVYQWRVTRRTGHHAPGLSLP